MSIDLSGVFFRPFTRESGSRVLLSGSNVILKVYPTKLIISLLDSDKASTTLSFSFASPVIRFEVMQDIKRDLIRVTGSTKEGMFSYTIRATKGHLALQFTKLSGQCRVEGAASLKASQGSLIDIEFPLQCSSFNKSTILHMGCFKKQHLERMIDRFSLQEMLPYFFMLGKKYLDSDPWQIPNIGDKHPLYKLSEAIKVGEKRELHALFLQMYRSCFRELFIPCFSDDHYWDGDGASEPQKATPFLTLLYKLTRSLFVQWDGACLKLLPLVPSDCLSGQIQDCALGENLVLSLKWSKGKIFMVELRAHQSCSFSIDMSKYSRGYRYYSSLKARGERKSDSHFTLEAGQRVFLDRWEA